MASWLPENEVKNFHVPLPERTYALLKLEAGRARLPATTLAREAIDAWLNDQARKAQHQAIAQYAADMAGSPLDLDRDLEAAGIEQITPRTKAPSKPRSRMKK